MECGKANGLYKNSHNGDISEIIGSCVGYNQTHYSRWDSKLEDKMLNDG